MLWTDELIFSGFINCVLKPYFGTPAQKECSNNIDVNGDFKTLTGGKYFYLKVLANEFYAMGDCLKENNIQEVFYEFYMCDDGNFLIMSFEVGKFFNLKIRFDVFKKIGKADGKILNSYSLLENFKDYSEKIELSPEHL